MLVFVLGLFGQCAFSRPDDIPVIIHRDWNNRVELVSSCVKDTVRVWVGVTLRFNAEFFEQTRQVKLSSVTFSSLALNVKDSSGKVRYLKYDRYDMPPDSVRCIWDVCDSSVWFLIPVINIGIFASDCPKTLIHDTPTTNSNKTFFMLLHFPINSNINCPSL